MLIQVFAKLGKFECIKINVKILKRCDVILFNRLDFDTAVFRQPDSTTSGSIGSCTSRDTVTVTSPAGISPPVFCGTFTGSHSKIWRKELILKGFKEASWACKGFKARRLSIFT